MGNSQYLLSAGLELFFALVSVILLAGCLLDHERKRKATRIMLVILLCNALMNVFNACVWLWCNVPQLLLFINILSYASYTIGSVIIMLFSYLMVTTVREYHTVPPWVDRIILLLGMAMTALWVASLFSGMYYYWDTGAFCLIWPLLQLGQGFGIVLFVFDIVIVLLYRTSLSRKDSAVLILCSVIPLFSYVFVYQGNVMPQHLATTIVLLLYYVIIHVEHGQRVAEQETMLVKQELELTNSRTAIVLTQIQPHFLYNSLTAIAQLCEKNPAKAKEMTINFSEYLRSNMNSLDQKEPIFFEKELEHVRRYLSIEQVRFGEDLHIVYDISAVDFRLPPLSLQPIVENAVKHGVGMKEDGGTVTVATREAADAYEVTVTDDGIGFDPNRRPKDGKSHVGMTLVRIRLERLVGGSMIVDSTPGHGTTVTIRVPKNGNERC